MNKSIHYIIILILVNISIARAVDMSYYVDDLPKVEKCKGGYSKCEIYSYDFKFGKVNSKSKVLYGTLLYNEFGNCISKIYYYSKMNKKLKDIKYDYEYDSTQKLIKMKEINQKSMVNSIYKYKDSLLVEKEIKNNVTIEIHRDKIIYNDKIQIIKTESSYNNEQYKGSYFEYDNRNLIVKKVNYEFGDSGDSIVAEYNYTYDDKNNVIIRELVEDETIKYKYNDKNELIEETKYLSDDDFDNNCKIKYDDLGNKIELIYYFIPEYPILKFEYIYSK